MLRYGNGKGSITISIGVDGYVVVRCFGDAITDKGKRIAATSISGKLKEPEKVWNAIKYDFKDYKKII
ncbi:MAG: hypothetical protein HUK20_05880 [Fibrobacter sp.]|nr:hypothetical protein [Fibrobacter sp.]